MTFDLTLTRTYNSLNYETTNVGKGFSFSYDMKIITDPHEPNNKCVVLPSGSMWTFEESGGVFTALVQSGVSSCIQLASRNFKMQGSDDARTRSTKGGADAAVWNLCR